MEAVAWLIFAREWEWKCVSQLADESEQTHLVTFEKKRAKERREVAHSMPR